MKSEEVIIKTQSTTKAAGGRLLMTLPNSGFYCGSVDLKLSIVGFPVETKRMMEIGEVYYYSPTPNEKFEIRLLALRATEATFLVTQIDGHHVA